MKCPKCQSDTKVVPAGVSKKSGKAYPAFTTCTNRECDYTANTNIGNTSQSTSQTPQDVPQGGSILNQVVEVLEAIRSELERANDIAEEKITITKEKPIGEPTKADFTKKYEDLTDEEGDKVPF